MVDKIYALAVRYAQLGVSAENVLHIRKTSAGDPSDAQWLVIANRWKETLRPFQSSSLLWVDYVATQVLGTGVTYSTSNCRQIGGTLQAGPLTGTLAGADVTQPLPPHDAITVAVSTGLRGRSYRTHVQTGGWCEDENDGGLVSAALTAALDAALATFLGFYKSGGTDADFDWCTFSRGIASGCYPNPDLRHHPLVHRQAGDEAASYASVTSAFSSVVFSTMRSRRR